MGGKRGSFEVSEERQIIGNRSADVNPRVPSPFILLLLPDRVKQLMRLLFERTTGTRVPVFFSFTPKTGSSTPHTCLKKCANALSACHVKPSVTWLPFWGSG
jgi:hypothetical protein